MDLPQLKKKAEELRYYLLNRYPEVSSLWFNIQGNNILFLSKIEVNLEDRRRGVGSKVIDELKIFSDAHNLTILLSPEAQHGYKDKLDRFYKGHGFIFNKGRNLDTSISSPFAKTMYRRPKIGEGRIKLKELLVENSDYDVAEDFHTRRDEQLQYLCRSLKDSKGKGRLHWKTIPASLLKRVWMQFGKYNKINSNDLDKISDQMLTNIARLRASTEMMGHARIGKQDIEDETGYEFTDEEWNDWMASYFTDLNGDWLLSDYGLPKLEKIYPSIFNAKTDEEKLYAIDKALNVIHQRSDLASMFVEGGSKTLMDIFNQGGYSSPD